MRLIDQIGDAIEGYFNRYHNPPDYILINVLDREKIDKEVGHIIPVNPHNPENDGIIHNVDIKVDYGSEIQPGEFQLVTEPVKLKFEETSPKN